jgi:hypothetical protein
MPILFNFLETDRTPNFLRLDRKTIKIHTKQLLIYAKYATAYVYV